MIRHLLAVLGICAASLANAQALSTAIFAGGCFWCMEEAFEKVPGVISVTSGYTDGKTRNPSYEEVSSGRTGHAEAIEVKFDPAKVSYEKLLDVFWVNHDPTYADRQFCDHGSQYRSVIFFLNEDQRRLAESSRSALASNKQLKGEIVTQIAKADTFYPAEGYHQDYYKKSPTSYHAYREGCGRDDRVQQLWGSH